MAMDLQRFAGDDEPETGDTSNTSETEVTTETQDTVPRTQYELLQRELEELKQRNDQLLQTLANLPYRLGQWGDNYQSQQAVTSKPEPEEDEKEPDWERMTPEELARYVAEKVEKNVLSKIEPRLQSVSQSSEELRLLREIDTVRAKYPDFEALRPIMQRVAQEMEAQGIDTSRIGVERLYLMVKGQQLGRNGVTQVAARPVSPPRSKTTSSEKPGVAHNAATLGTLTAQEAFEEAWRSAGLDKIFGT